MSIPFNRIMIPMSEMTNLYIKNNENIHYQKSFKELIEQTVERNQGTLSDTGSLIINTGKFSGRSPNDKFIVLDDITKNTVNWNEFNIPTEPEIFSKLSDKIFDYLTSKNEFWVRDCIACADDEHQMKIRVFTETPWANLFASNMFINPTEKQLENFAPNWNIICAPSFLANPEIDGTRSENFAMVSFTKRTIIIGGTGYTGEIKKGIFTVLNFILPQEKKVLSMHCSANEGKNGDTAIFFGLSGTGKTTLSADSSRHLIGDDEHGWDNDSIFNFEGGCYAKCIDLSAEKEPEIFAALKPGALIENTTFFEGTNKVDFSSKVITENTRVSYPLSFINNAKIPSFGNTPKHIFFLTCDSFGILPPISKLNTEQAMYQFMSGYTAKIAGTEAGIKEPKSTFSACFGAPFMPLHPSKYAKLLGEKLSKYKTQVWLINTGWTGGAYGVGKRISLKYTRSMINAVLNNELENTEFENFEIFNFQIPKAINNVPSELLQPMNTWEDKNLYIEKANYLAQLFKTNFKKFEENTAVEIVNAGPQI